MLSEALRLIRVFHDLKQGALAERLGLSKSYVSEIEAGHKTPSLEVIEKYANMFDMPVSSILFFAEQLSEKSTKSRKERARTAIARKVLDFLGFVEQGTSKNDKENDSEESKIS